uniref:NADH dehydrogenase subunit 6 n=1 Tax=Gnathostoma spinigerum TaxID=75299 RepID=A0A0K0NPK5_9BILA|nr:NADH dehydrogenase subunit 6 [Gnathostoma spinigerum]AKM22106.1 NADH dehydrogenase subunit 6 [Gnathostoma spinigerum]
MLFLMVVSSLFFGVMCYYMSDPMKSSFFLILSLLGIVPLISMSGSVWYSYFICLLFLSGIFVILVYFSSLSSVIGFFKPLFFLLVVLSFLMLIFCLPTYLVGVVLMNNFYWSFNFFVFFWLVFVLLFFMNFTSYFVGMSGSLRSV